MNWVGGSRNRLVMKNNANKQREFFEKRRMQQKSKHLKIALPAPSPEIFYGSLDMLNLFVVNQIAAKKETKDSSKLQVFGRPKGGPKLKRHKSLVLPMSPCSPSQLSLAESQSPYSAPEIRKRVHVSPQGFKCRQLSPVLESAFSDNSASDYLPPTADPLTPFSSTSSASSGQGMFPLQIGLQQKSQTQAQLLPHCSPCTQDFSGLNQTQLSNCTYTNLCSGHETGLMNSSEHLPTFSCRWGYLSSDSNDKEESSQLYFNSSSFLCNNQSCCVDTPRVNQGSQEKPQQRHSQPSPFRKTEKLREYQKATENEYCPDEANRNNVSCSAQFLCPHHLTQAQSCGLCKYEKTMIETREAGTQTDCLLNMCDASTQCNSLYKATELGSVQQSATGRQTNTATDKNTHQTSLGNWGGGISMLRRNKSKDYSVSESCNITKFIHSDSEEFSKPFY